VGVYEPIAPFGQLRAGMGKVGTQWRMGVGDLAAQNGVLLNWATTGTVDEPRIVVANGSLATPVFLVDREGDVTVRGTTVALPNIPSGSTATEVLVWNAGNVERSTASGLISGLAWALTGNSGTNPAVNFLGTTDARPLVIRTNNIERLRVTATGNVLPGADNTYELGSPTDRWANLYAYNGQVSNDLTVSNTLNVGNGIVVSTGGITVGGGGATILGNSSITGDLTVTGNVLPGADNTYELANGVVVVEIDGGSGTVTLPSGTQGQLLFIRRYNASGNLTLPGVEPNGSGFSSTANFHAILMYIGGAWRLMSLR
jgi:hypothetical protein